jgi:hypothetical protein
VVTDLCARYPNVPVRSTVSSAETKDNARPNLKVKSLWLGSQQANWSFSTVTSVATSSQRFGSDLKTYQVINVLPGYRAAVHDLVFMSDSRMRVLPHTLRSLVGAIYHWGTSGKRGLSSRVT